VAYLAGEWWTANIGFGLVLLIAGIGCVLLGWWVVRGDRLNRARETAELEEAARAEGHSEGEHPT
jgi:hypothetical protein